MHNSFLNSWLGLGIDAWKLGLESSAVIGLRTMQFDWADRTSQAEAWRMVEEKIAAAVEVQTALVTGRLGTDPLVAGRSVLQYYTRRVRANRLRLTGRGMARKQR